MMLLMASVSTFAQTNVSTQDSQQQTLISPLDDFVKYMQVSLDMSDEQTASFRKIFSESMNKQVAFEDRKAEMEKLDKEINNILTPEQRVKLAEIKKKMAQDRNNK